MSGRLDVAPGIPFDASYVTKTVAILALKRVGKTYTAHVIAEELVKAGQPFVALDPTGVWWGLRSSKSGRGEGLPVVILGGSHGDLPLSPKAGRFVADLVLDRPGFYVLDFSLFATKPEERAFASAFGDRLYRRKMTPGMNFPLHLFVDEADFFVPQERDQGTGAMLAAFEAIVRRGGVHGLGTTLISQRPALVNKNVLTQIELLILLRLMAGQDQDAVDKNYLSRAATKEERAEVMSSLATLKLGEAWFFEPAAQPRLLARAKVRERRTFNSSATPKPGERWIEPTRYAAIELAEVAHSMSEAIELAEAEDPAALRRRVKELQNLVASLESRPVGKTQLVEKTLEVKVPVFPDELRSVSDELRSMAETLSEQVGRLRSTAEVIDSVRRKTAPRAASAKTEPAEAPTSAASEVRHLGASTRRAEPEPRTVHLEASGLDQFRKGARRMVEVLARHHPMRMTKTQLGTLAKVKASGGTFSTYLGELRRAGVVDLDADGLLVITPSGLEAAGAVAPEPMSTEEIVAIWRSSLRAGARRMLDVLIEAHPEGVSRDQLAEAAGIEVSGGTFSTYLGQLRRNGLAEVAGDRIRAGSALFVASDVA